MKTFAEVYEEAVKAVRDPIHPLPADEVRRQAVFYVLRALWDEVRSLRAELADVKRTAEKPDPRHWGWRGR